MYSRNTGAGESGYKGVQAMGWLAVCIRRPGCGGHHHKSRRLTAKAGAGSAAQRIDVFKTVPEEYNRVTVPVTVEGQGPFHFMIDTGAQATILSLGLADRLGIADRKTATLVGISSRAQTAGRPGDGTRAGPQAVLHRNRAAGSAGQHRQRRRHPRPRQPAGTARAARFQGQDLSRSPTPKRSAATRATTSWCARAACSASWSSPMPSSTGSRSR